MLLTEIVLLLLLVLAASLAVYRVHLLRQRGTEVVLRSLPAAAGRGWRHGVLRYSDAELLFFRVSSLRPGPDRSISRSALVVLDRRGPQPPERDVVPPGSSVLRFEAGGNEIEVALDEGGLTAFLSWVESSPPGRSRREVPR